MMMMNTQQTTQDTKPFFSYAKYLTLSAVNVEVEDVIQFPSDADFLVMHLDVSLFDQTGNRHEGLQVRDEVLIQISDENSGNSYFNQATDLYMLRRFTTSDGFRPFILPRRTQLKFKAKVSNFVNGGTAVGTLPYKVWIAFLGRKINGED